MQRIITVMALMGLLVVPAFAIALPSPGAYAQTRSAVCDGIEATGGSCAADPAENSINDLIASIINIFSWIVGVVAVIFVIFGGFKYITSAGDSNKVSSAKSTIIYALVGLVIVALAQVIVVFVLNASTP